jgi:uncharacterized membrane-anchored protein
MKLHQLTTLLFTLGISAAYAQEPTPEQIAEYQAWEKQFIEGLTPQSGTIELPNGVASLTLPDSFVYYSPEDSKLILEEAWGNPPDPDMNQGMIFPSKYSPLDDETWAVTIDYSEEGYVSDEDAGEIDYDELLAEMKADVEASNEARKSMGYETIHLLDWASKPFYDQTNNKLHWAKEIQFEGIPENTLNYSIRALGRKGILELNFIASMSQLPEIQQNMDEVMQMTAFNPGFRYDEFDPSIDKVAAYGIGALVAGKVLAKVGILAKILFAFKKLWILVAIGAVGLFKKLRGSASA